MRRSAVVAIAVGVLVAGLAAASAAAPGDPAPTWPVRYAMAPRDAAVAGSGRVFEVGLPRTGSLDHSVLSHGRTASIFNEWSSVRLPPSSDGGVIAGRGDYAVAVTGNTSRVFDGTDGVNWLDPVTIAEGIEESNLVGNADGDAALLWNTADGTPFVSRMARGGTWETVSAPDLPLDAPRDVVINNAGKITVVWAVPTGTTSEIRRSILRAGSTAWSSALRVGIVDNPRPRLSIVTDGQGRETVIARNMLWRQESSNRLPVFQFRTSVRAKAATGDTVTRIVWPAKSDGRYEIRTRYVGQDNDWRDQTVLWSRRAPLDPVCDRGIEFGVGMIPGGRSYVAAGIRHEADPVNDVCDGREIADFLTVNLSDDVLNLQDLGYYSMGGPFRIKAGTAGPVVLEYKTGHVPGDPEFPFDGSWVMRFFTR